MRLLGILVKLSALEIDSSESEIGIPIDTNCRLRSYDRRFGIKFDEFVYWERELNRFGTRFIIQFDENSLNGERIFITIRIAYLKRSVRFRTAIWYARLGSRFASVLPFPVTMNKNSLNRRRILE
ncbi:hypothetical protein E3N88_43713 [Mikania micrantha]|uniref:Uncharacterized protein n=1 Tax=Mikania micrantha TaxID=192012 RepID=A0A5N6LEN8_9ASTR|nr:hypothetical protein E3N88_43713 [Mikania micrantha]